MPRRSRPPYNDYDRDYDRPNAYDAYGGRGRGGGNPPKVRSPLDYAKYALLGGVFILGVGVGIAFSSSTNFNPASIDSRIEIDRQAPNAELCQQYGASAIVTDMRVFLTLNPFNVFVTQPVMQPGCVLRQNNWAVLEQNKLVNSEQVRDCKQRMNTFGFTGRLDSNPKINCIYQNEAAGNLFLNQPGATAAPESENF
jgi:hypothetical protein